VTGCHVAQSSACDGLRAGGSQSRNRVDASRARPRRRRRRVRDIRISPLFRARTRQAVGGACATSGAVRSTSGAPAQAAAAHAHSAAVDSMRAARAFPGASAPCLAAKRFAPHALNRNTLSREHLVLQREHRRCRLIDVSHERQRPLQHRLEPLTILNPRRRILVLDD